MSTVSRYLRLMLALGRYSLARELAFRSNFIAKVIVEILWLSILLVFYDTIFSKTSVIAAWTREDYLFFVGCYFSMEGTIETFFLENCNEFADLVRSGDLDFYLLKPIDEQFLVTSRKIDWSTAPNILMGIGVMLIALQQKQWEPDVIRMLLFGLLFLAGTAIAYSFLLILTSASVWLMRNQSLFEMWWLFSSFMRYPREIFAGRLAYPMGWVFTFVIPILLVINVPADIMVHALEPGMVAFTLVVTVLLLILSRLWFRRALRQYRSASS